MKKDSINVNELMYVLDNTPSEQVVMLKGAHGIGKSSILTAYYMQKGMKVVTFFLGQMSDPGDLIGLPHKVGERTEFLPPSWFPTDKEPIVLFLDELNRARPELLQAVMDLVLNKQLAGKSLPHGSIIIAAVNDGDDYAVNDLDPALVSRFNVYTFSPSASEWLNWANNNNIDGRVIKFIEQNPNWLDGDPTLKSMPDGLVKTPDRRAWKKVADYIKGRAKLNNIDRKVIAGIIGAKAMMQFLCSNAHQDDVNVTTLLENFQAVEPQLKTMRSAELAIVIQGVVNNLSNAEANADRERNAVDFVNFLLDKGNLELLSLLNNYCEKKIPAIDDKYPDLADLLFSVKAELLR